jgi:hypothetical protein
MRRHRTFKIALVVFFLLYGLSPLTYDLSAKSVTFRQSGGTPGRTFRNASLYLIEILYEAFSQPAEDEPENESSPNRVLITKKSAVQRGRLDLVSQSGRVAVFAPAPADPRQYSGIEYERAEIRWSMLRKNSDCLPLSSGLSPPPLS